MLILFGIGPSSCTINNRIKEGEIYLKKQRIVVHKDTNQYKVSSDELMALSRLKTNRRVLLARFNLGVYTLVPDKALQRSNVRLVTKCEKRNIRRNAKGKPDVVCTNLWTWMAYTVGEPPAQLDSAKMEKSAEQMRIMLTKQGYFHARVVPEVIYKNKGLIWWRKGKKAKVDFHVYPGTLFRVNSIAFRIEDTSIATREEELKERCSIQPGQAFNVSALDNEREAIAAYLNDRGYYSFTKDYITYLADSSLAGSKVNLTLQLNALHFTTAKSDSVLVLNHKRYFIGEIFINTVYDPRNPDEAPLDSLRYDHLWMLYNGEKFIRPSLLDYSTPIGPAEIYQKSKIDQTYKRFVQLGLFKSVTIQLNPRAEQDSTGLNFIDVKILLNQAPRQSIAFDPRVTNRAGNMGIYGNLIYRHKNLSKGAQRLEARILGGFEATQTLGLTSSSTTGTQQLERSLRLNTFEIGPEITLRVPLVKPTRLYSFKRSSEPALTITALLNYQIRPDYERTLAQLNWGVQWIENPSVVRRIFFDIAEFSIIKINKSAAFDDFINRLNDTFLANSYRDHLILATRLGMTVNTQKPKFQRSYTFWRSSIEGAGNMLRSVFEFNDAPLDEAGSYEIAGIRFAQYFKLESDYRGYFNLNERNQLVWRQYSGIGRPGRNLSRLPFEKSFFSGGANGLRAWQARTLGPGASRDSLKTFNNIGDIKLEFNLEFRFKLTKMFQAAFFADAGNIWLARPDERRPNAEFEWSRFYKEVALGGGVGIRLDFEYFLVRLDMGLQMHDPSKIEGERWFFQPKTEYNQFLAQADFDTKTYNFWRSRVFNLGIGFPF